MLLRGLALLHQHSAQDLIIIGGEPDAREVYVHDSRPNGPNTPVATLLRCHLS